MTIESRGNESQSRKIKTQCHLVKLQDIEEKNKSIRLVEKEALEKTKGRIIKDNGS